MMMLMPIIIIIIFLFLSNYISSTYILFSSLGYVHTHTHNSSSLYAGLKIEPSLAPTNNTPIFIFLSLHPAFKLSTFHFPMSLIPLTFSLVLLIHYALIVFLFLKFTPPYFFHSLLFSFFLYPSNSLFFHL